MEKQFSFEQDNGFVWHKSWNIPEIRLSMSENEF